MFLICLVVHEKFYTLRSDWGFDSRTLCYCFGSTRVLASNWKHHFRAGPKNRVPARFPGKFLLITFGYTFCPDICPTGLARITAALNRLGKTADLVQPLFISVDPNRDTPEALATYVTHFHPRMRGLTGNKDEIDSVTRTYRVLRHVVHQDDASEYLLNHTTFFYLVAPTGKIARIFRHATGVDALADAISVELAQKSWRWLATFSIILRSNLQ